MGEIAKALGQGALIHFRDRDYRVAFPPPLEVQGQFELWLESRAWGSCARSARALPADQSDALRSQVNQDVAAGVYSWGMPAAAKALNAPPGQKHLLYLMLKFCRENVEVTPALAEAIYDEAFAELMALFGAGDQDPNAPAPASPGTA